MAKLTGATWSFAGHASDIYLDAGMLREKIRRATFVTTCTKHNKEYLIGVGGPDTARQDHRELSRRRPRPLPAIARAEPAARSGILTVGTLRECKGLPDLIEACRMLAPAWRAVRVRHRRRR